MWSIKQSLRDFRDDESGLILAEFVIVLPMLIWAFMALFVYWDVFRSMNTAQKAGYAISDLISRTRDDLTVSYLDGMQTVMNYMLPVSQTAKMRFTSVKWSTPNNRFEVIWSKSPGAKMPELNTASLQTYVSQIPIMAATDTVMIVETSVPYTTPMEVGLAGNYTFDEFIVTRPRFLTKICLKTFVTVDCPAPA